jgi:hypothetical protein
MSGTIVDNCLTNKSILDWSGLPRNAILTRCPHAGSASLQDLNSLVYVVDNVHVKTTVASLLIFASVGHSNTDPNVLQ